MTAEQRAGLSDAALAMTQPCIDELIKDISRRVQKAGAITDTAEYQLYRAQALGESKKAIEQAVSKQIGISEEVIASLFEYVADKSLGLDENGSLKRMTEAYTRMTQSKTRELLRDLWADTPEGKVQPLQTAYARAMDFAFRQVATGTLDLDTAIRRAVTPLAKRGLRTIEQKSGRSVGIEYACRRYIMDQLGQLDDEIQRADHDALGCDGWEISAHAACAPDHEPIQGRQYGDAEFEKLNNSLQRRIGRLNCGHTANPIILGVNAPQYTEAQLQKFKDDNERGVVYNGYRYTLYEAGQEQSRIENGIRLIKRQILADEETESPDLQKHQIKLRVVQAEYARFCKAVGLPTRSERLQVAGFGRSQSNRAVWAYKKAAPEQLRDVEIAGHKLYSVTDERIRAVPKPFFQGVSNKVNGLAQEYARGVLKKVQGLEVGTEAVVNFTKDGKCTGYYVGGQNSMKVKPPEIQVPYYSLHNHPSNGMGTMRKSTTRSPPRSTRALSPRPTTTRPRTPSVQRQRLWPTPTRRWPSTRTPTSTACARAPRNGRPRQSRPRKTRTPALRRCSLMQSWIPLLLPRMGAAARPSAPCSIWTPCAAAKTPTRTFPPHCPRCRRTAAICSTPRKLRRPMLQARAAPP